MKNLYEILVPCKFNDDRPVRKRHHQEWDRRVRAITNGLTILRPARGQWVNEDTLYEERVIPVRIFCTKDQIEKIAAITIQHYEQLAVMYYRVSDDCNIVEASEAQLSKFVRPLERTE